MSNLLYIVQGKFGKNVLFPDEAYEAGQTVSLDLNLVNIFIIGHIPRYSSKFRLMILHSLTIRMNLQQIQTRPVFLFFNGIPEKDVIHQHQERYAMLLLKRNIKKFVMDTSILQKHVLFLKYMQLNYLYRTMYVNDISIIHCFVLPLL